VILSQELAAGAVPFNEPVAARVDPGEKLTASFSPIQNVATFAVPIVAASKHKDSTYEVRMDGEQVFGPAPVPPTDVDDLQQTFLPEREFERSMTVVCRNLSGSTTRRYVVQPVGWEVSQ